MSCNATHNTLKVISSQLPLKPSDVSKIVTFKKPAFQHVFFIRHCGYRYKFRYNRAQLLVQLYHTISYTVVRAVNNTLKYCIMEQRARSVASGTQLPPHSGHI